MQHVDPVSGAQPSPEPVEPAQPTTEPTPAPARRRWPQRLVVGLLVAIAASALAATAVSSVRGEDWRERAEARDGRIGELEAALERSEADVAELTQRVDELVAARAAAEGERDGALIEVQQANELTRLSGLVAEDLEACVDGTAALIDVILDVTSYDTVESSTFAAEVSRVCANARTSNDRLQQVLAGL